jgi:hypothetical protein
LRSRVCHLRSAKGGARDFDEGEDSGFEEELSSEWRRAYGVDGSTMLLAHRIRLDPNNVQATYLARAAGTTRFAYNWALAEW